MSAEIMPHGWMARETLGRPRARFCGFLAVIWATVSIIAALLLWQGLDTPELAEIRRLAWLLLLPEPVFIGLAVFFRLTEAPRAIPAPLDWHGPILH